MAAEVRQAPRCSLCRKRKGALSPQAVEGPHDDPGALPELVVEVIHRLVTDPARLSRSWFEGVVARGLGDAEYVEIVGVATSVLSIDAFHDALGVHLEPLPTPQPGEPSRRRPPGAALEGAWVPMLRPDRLTGEDRDLYGGRRTPGNVIRAMSLVPAEVRGLQDLAAAQYLSLEEMAQLDRGRTLDRAQIELVAGRVSALNECFY
jgi:hypothetical protein